MKKKDIAVCAVIFILFSIYFCYLNYEKWLGFGFYFDDAYYQKLYLSIIESSKHSENLYTSSYGYKNIFFDHLYFSSLIYLPFYYVFKHPLTLRFLQVFFVFSGIFIYIRLLRKKFGDASFFSALAVSLVFCLHPTIQGALVTTTHTSAFIQIFAPALFYFYFTKKIKAYITVAFMIMLTREDMAFIIIGWSMITFFKYKDYKLSLFTFFCALLYLLAAMFIIQPALLAGNNCEHLLMNKYYCQFGNTYSEILKNIFLRFDIVIKHFTSKSAIFVFFILSAPFVFFPFARLYFILPVMPLICLNILSVFPGMQDPKNYYYAPIVPFALIAFIFFIYDLPQRLRKICFCIAVILAFTVSFRWGYLPISPYTKSLLKNSGEINMQNLNFIKNNINDINAGIAASEFLANYFILNQELYIFDKDVPFEKFENKIKYIIGFDFQLKLFEEYKDKFSIVARRGNLFLMRRISDDNKSKKIISSLTI